MKEQKLKDNLISYTDYCNQIKLWEKGVFEGDWQLSQALLDKVADDGSFKNFYGDTTVLFFNSDQRMQFLKIQKDLENEFTHFANPLNPLQFHLTVHDLFNSPNKSEIEMDLKSGYQKSLDILKAYLEKYPQGNFIKLRSTSIFPSGQVALVVGFLPQTKEDYQKFLELYNLFEAVRYLDYWPRPHVTLNYFLPKKLVRDEIKKLKEIASRDYEIKIELDLTKTLYQCFDNMNHYYTC